MAQFYLIQRGKFRSNPIEATRFLSGRSDALIDPDYMGSAEFEWGAIPSAYRRIFDHKDEYKMFVTDLKTLSGVPFNLYCKADCYDSIMSELKNYIEKEYRLKEWSNLPCHFKKVPGSSRYELKTDFWWCIDMSDIGDWIGFIGAADRKSAMERIIDADYKEIWESLTEDEKKEKRSQIYRW